MDLRDTEKWTGTDERPPEGDSGAGRVVRWSRRFGTTRVGDLGINLTVTRWTENGGSVEWYRRGRIDPADAYRLRDLVDELLPHLLRQPRKSRSMPREGE